MWKKEEVEHDLRSFRIVCRYLLFQLPGWIILTLIMLLVDRWFDFPTWLMISAILTVIAKDAVMYPLVWRAYDPNPKMMAYRLVGERAVARGRLAPHGYVQVHGELWKAELMDGTAVEEGQAVRVREVKGLTLLVQPEES